MGQGVKRGSRGGRGDAEALTGCGAVGRTLRLCVHGCWGGGTLTWRPDAPEQALDPITHALLQDEDGNVEYKLRLKDINPVRLQQLVRVWQW